MNPVIAFRTDASLDIGTGHVMRCLTLADALGERGADCTFVCRPHAGHLLDTVAQRGHRALALPTLDACLSTSPSDLAHAAWLGTDWESDARDTAQALEPLGPLDALVVDHYALDTRWEQRLRPLTHTLMAIDDLADRPHDCDLLLDQNLGRHADDYSAWLPGHAQRLIGPQFALLRPGFAELRPQSLARRRGASPKPPLRLLISLGGVDRDNLTGQVLDALRVVPQLHPLHITVVMGPHAPWRDQVERQVQYMPCPTDVRVAVSDMATLMADSDLAIGAAGSTAWERCCLGLPTLQIILADNQRLSAQALADAGACVTLASASGLTAEATFRLGNLLDDAPALLQISRAASGVCDGLGSARVCEALLTCLEVMPEVSHDSL